MFGKILIANRGEIAARILRACRELGVRGAAVYSEADARAMHVRQADEAVLIGPAPALQSYLSIERILEAARQVGAEAIHPGYGFLSENARFAQAVQDAGLVFIGPPPSAIQALGSKANARALAQAAGVPVVPGYQGADDDAALEQAAGEIGFPLLVKAAAGGGGRGMRVIRTPDQLSEGLAAARRESLHAFGDQRLILEKYLERAHHIEIQVLGDQHGHLVHLFERECSVQRRHQKIIEESPSPLLDPDLRQRMGADAVLAARSAGYFNAGTVEFIFDPASRQYYFLEMNTRLQVEHPVTELVTGLDLVQWQIRIAAGEPLTFTQADLGQHGHAIECRIYAEDPANQFLPSAGRVFVFGRPQGPGVRLDAGVESGDEVSIHYDPLLAKLICSASDRPAALRRMQAALRQAAALGLTTNLAFLQDVLAEPDFLAGAVHTTWVDQRFAGWRPADVSAEPPLEILAAAGLWLSLPSETALRAGAARPASVCDPYSPWQPAGYDLPGQNRPVQAGAGRQNSGVPNSGGRFAQTFVCAGRTYPLDLTPQSGAWLARSGDKSAQVELLARQDDGIALRLDGRIWRILCAADGDTLWAACDGRTYQLETGVRPAASGRKPGKPGAAQPAETVLRAPMPAQVRAINARPGDTVTKGQTLLVLEAMKMEIRIQAPFAGQVERLLVTAGQQVNRDQGLLELTPLSEPA